MSDLKSLSTIPRDGRTIKVDNNHSRMGSPKGSDEVTCYSMGLKSRINQSSSCPQMLLRLVEGSKGPWYRKVMMIRRQRAIGPLAPGPPIDRQSSSSTSFSLPPLPPFIFPTNGTTLSVINAVAGWKKRK
jgi:hypothetical protein